nr:hypothetical protein [Tanacetum cinerariifolium]
EINELKAQTQEKDTVILKLKEKIKSLCADDKESKVEDIETQNLELDHRVTKLTAENNHLKQTYKQLFDSIKSSRVQSKEQCDDLINQVNLKSLEVIDLNASLQERILVISALKEQLKGKVVLSKAVTLNPIDPAILQVDAIPLVPKLRKNRTAHIDYLKHTLKEAATLRELVESERLLSPLNQWLSHQRTRTNRLENGVAERRNGTLIEAARTMLADAKLHVDAGTTSINLLGIKDTANQEVKKYVSSLRYIVLPNWAHDALLESSSSKSHDESSSQVPKGSGNPNPTASSSNPPADQMDTLTVESPIPTVSSPVLTACLNDSPEPSSEARLISKRVSNQEETPSLDNILSLTNRFKDILGVPTSSSETIGVEADSLTLPSTPTLNPGESSEPVPQDEDEREPRFIQAHDPDFVPEPVYPEYIQLEDEHVLPAEEQPLPPVDSPTTESPGYVAESDPEYEDDEEQDVLDEDIEEEKEDEEEEEEEEHIASADSIAVIPALRITSTQALTDAVTAALPSSSVDCRDEIPESKRPPRKRSCLFTIGSRYKARESSTTRPTRGQGTDYRFVSTVDFEARRQGIRDVGYGIRDTWIDPAEAVPAIVTTTVEEVNTRVVELVELHEHDIQDFHALLEDAQDGRSRISQRVDKNSQQTAMAKLQETDRKRQVQLTETLRVVRDMRWEMSDMQKELISQREQLRRERQPGPDAIFPDHQETPPPTNPNNMTPEAIQTMIDQALLRNSGGGDGSHSSHAENPSVTPPNWPAAEYWVRGVLRHRSTTQDIY